VRWVKNFLASAPEEGDGNLGGEDELQGQSVGIGKGVGECGRAREYAEGK